MKRPPTPAGQPVEGVSATFSYVPTIKSLQLFGKVNSWVLGGLLAASGVVHFGTSAFLPDTLRNGAHHAHELGGRSAFKQAICAASQHACTPHPAYHVLCPEYPSQDLDVVEGRPGICAGIWG